jgi:hypothetical protein
VFVVDSVKGIAHRHFVTPQALLNDGVALGGDIGAGALVVVSGQHKLVDSASVHIAAR